MSPRSGQSNRTSARVGPGRCALIIVENQTYVTDTRVKAEATSLREAGWRVHVICPAPPGAAPGPGRAAAYAETEAGGIIVHTYRMKFAARGVARYIKEYFLSLFHISRLALRIDRKERFAVVHLCNPPDLLFVAGALLKLRGVKVIFDHHDLFPEMILSRHKGPLGWTFYRLSRLLEFMTFRTADAVLSTNESYRDVAIRRGRLDARDVFIVRNGPSPEEICPVPPEPALKRGFPLMACYAGIMGPEDGVLELIEVIRDVVERQGRADILFCLLGDGAAKREAEDRAREWGVGDHVVMPGMVLDRALFRRYLSTADIMLAPETSNPHNDKSTFIKIAEYMAMGKPIVAYDLKETRFTAGDAAVYAPSGDIRAYASALVGLMEDPARRARLGEIGVERIRDLFQWEHQKVHLLEAYDHVLRTDG